MADGMLKKANLLTQLKMASAHACDVLRDIAEAAGADCEVTVVISHPGTTEDSFVVGQHELSALFAILTRISTGNSVECDVSSTFVGADERAAPSVVQ